MTELPGINWSDYEKPLEPHQMSPQQFAEHKHAVFHSTHLADPLNLDKRSSIHVGTLAAAMERHGATGLQGGEMPGWTTDANIHVYHLKPTAEERITEIDDSDANLLGSWDPKHSDSPVHYYQNLVEDVSSTSAVVRDPSRLKSQSQFVEEAIRNGKVDEVHPFTMAKHLTGTLGVHKQPLQDTLSRVGKWTVRDTKLFETDGDGNIAGTAVNVSHYLHMNNVPHLGPDAERLRIMDPQPRDAPYYTERIASRNPALERGEVPPASRS